MKTSNRPTAAIVNHTLAYWDLIVHLNSLTRQLQAENGSLDWPGALSTMQAEDWAKITRSLRARKEKHA